MGGLPIDDKPKNNSFLATTLRDQGHEQQLVVEDASSRPQEDTNNKRTSLYGFETDSTWDDFCNELSVDE